MYSIGIGYNIVQKGSKLKPPPELPDGEYLVSLEDEFIVEEDNENNFLIQEPTA